MSFETPPETSPEPGPADPSTVGAQQPAVGRQSSRFNSTDIQAKARVALGTTAQWVLCLTGLASLAGATLESLHASLPGAWIGVGLLIGVLALIGVGFKKIPPVIFGVWGIAGFSILAWSGLWLTGPDKPGMTWIGQGPDFWASVCAGLGFAPFLGFSCRRLPMRFWAIPGGLVILGSVPFLMGIGRGIGVLDMAMGIGLDDLAFLPFQPSWAVLCFILPILGLLAAFWGLIGLGRHDPGSVALPLASAVLGLAPAGFAMALFLCQSRFGSGHRHGPGVPVPSDDRPRSPGLAGEALARDRDFLVPGDSWQAHRGHSEAPCPG